jgi:hypothetical protein
LGHPVCYDKNSIKQTIININKGEQQQLPPQQQQHQQQLDRSQHRQQYSRLLTRALAGFSLDWEI